MFLYVNFLCFSIFKKSVTFDNPAHDSLFIKSPPTLFELIVVIEPGVPQQSLYTYV